jgi:hypothetical protein
VRDVGQLARRLGLAPDRRQQLPLRDDACKQLRPLLIAAEPRDDAERMGVDLEQLRGDAVDQRQALDQLVVVAVAALPPQPGTAVLDGRRQREQPRRPQLGERLRGKRGGVV